MIKAFINNSNFDLLPFSIIMNNESLKSAVNDIIEPDNVFKNDYMKLMNYLIKEDEEKFYQSAKKNDFLRLLAPKVPIDAYDKVNERYKIFIKNIEKDL